MAREIYHHSNGPAVSAVRDCRESWPPGMLSHHPPIEGRGDGSRSDKGWFGEMQIDGSSGASEVGKLAVVISVALLIYGFFLGARLGGDSFSQVEPTIIHPNIKIPNLYCE